MESIIQKLNAIFLDCENIFNGINKKNIRNSKILFNNIIEYAFKYSKCNTTKRDIMSTLKTYTHRTSYDRKFKNIPEDFFKILFDKINKLFYDEIQSNNEFETILKSINNNFNESYINNNEKQYNIIAYDGTSNNRIQKGILNTDQNLFGYDINYNIPISLNNNDENKYNNKNNNSNKNSEITMFIDKIKNNGDVCKNKIIVADRLYSVYKLFNIINKNEGKYIIRLKENFDILNDNKIIKNKNNDNYKIKNSIRNDKTIRVVEYIQNKTCKLVKKTNEIVTVNVRSKFYLLTNLNVNDYDNDKIKNIYNSRWNIETFNKYIKNNFKFEKFYLKYNDEIQKLKYLDLIISLIIKLLILFCLYEKLKTNKNLLKDTITKKNKKINVDKRTKEYKNYMKNFKETEKVSVRANLTLFTTKFYEKIVSELVYGELKIKTMEDIMYKDLEIIKNELNRSFERKSIVPFTKWYVKMYHKMYEINKIFNAIENDTINELNKNLKCKAKVFEEAMNNYKIYCSS